MIETPNTARAWATDLAACLGIGVLLGVTGPFGSFFNDVLIVRVAYWSAVFVVCGLVLGLAIRALAPWARKARVPGWAWLPVMVLAMGLPLTLVTRLIAAAIWPAIRQAVSLVDWYGQTVVVCLVYVALHLMLHGAFRRGARAPVEAAASADPAGPRILRRLPPRLGQDLLCLSMEDHYVRLHTIEGSALVLMPLSQALEELGGLDGLQVHRSWWVARDAVESAVTDGRNLRLRLRGGIEAPVSRASVARLRAAGWLDDSFASGIGPRVGDAAGRA
ncbi:LytTR family DNA-binding domain-containing protein [Brevundimonas lenta]|uniref:DNA-binding LytR/AlgR family response regulator n=1 Tax=Brevundimonas lenta TaxID=424796 RepID=A0A7W6NQH2_9CAUL|nr:LytTR family DNA-binding domain-containing protein [Brevundimonas lenta]MBB4083913.1 DNA-binding LytR/AlgR family response regulator [Brevundimonas lenta]